MLALVAAAALLLLSPATVAADAELIETIPADGATVQGTPDELVAVFSDALLADRSTLSIRDAGGQRLAVGGLDPGDPARLLISEVPDLAPGTYEMRWTMATADNHLQRGTWSFAVTAAPSPTPSADATGSAPPRDAATPSATPDAVASPSPPPSPAPTEPAASSSDAILPIIAGLAIALIGGGLLLTRRNPRTRP